MTSDETQIQILANWPMSHAKRVTRDNWKNTVANVGSVRTLSCHCPVKLLTQYQPCIIVCYSVYFWLIRSSTDPAFTGSIFVCGPLHHNGLFGKQFHLNL